MPFSRAIASDSAVQSDCCCSIMESISLLANVSKIFVHKLLNDLDVNKERCAELIERSLIMVTSLAPEIGYDKAADVAKTAYNEGKTLKEVAVEKGYCNEEEFDKWVIPEEMIRPAE